MPTTSPVINLVVPAELLEEIEDFRFAHRFGSRAAAIKWLVSVGLHEGPKPDMNNRDDKDKYVRPGSRARKPK